MYFSLWENLTTPVRSDYVSLLNENKEVYLVESMKIYNLQRLNCSEVPIPVSQEFLLDQKGKWSTGTPSTAYGATLITILFRRFLFSSSRSHSHSYLTLNSVPHPYLLVPLLFSLTSRSRLRRWQGRHVCVHEKV
jgi:hypothetical protein